MNAFVNILLLASLAAPSPQVNTSASMSAPNINNILYVDGITFRGSPDLGATLNRMIAALPNVGGYPAGQIVIPPGSYAQSTTVIVNSPYVSFHGAGSGSTVV